MFFFILIMHFLSFNNVFFDKINQILMNEIALLKKINFEHDINIKLFVLYTMRIYNFI